MQTWNVAKTLLLGSACLAIMAGAADPWQQAQAGEVTIDGSGTFSGLAPTTPISKAGETFSFSFSLSTPVQASSFLGGAATNPTNFVYKLNNTQVAFGVSDVVFFAGTDHGLFQIDFDDGSFDYLRLFGPGIFNPGTAGATISTGTFSANLLSVDVETTTADSSAGRGQVTVPGPVPEPGGTSLLLAAIAGLAAFRRWGTAGKRGIGVTPANTA